MQRLTHPFMTILAILLVAALTAVWTADADSSTSGDALAFDDIQQQTAQFIAWAKSIQLTPEQEAIKKEALEALLAPCCSDNTAYTCCCPCNMSLSIWGLSNHLIAEQGWDAEQVRAKVVSWIETINPDGFSGNVCYTGGCRRPFAKNGCGGMRPGHVTWE